jgi:methenyltetrahydrofolate cyclohydrolase
MPRLEDWLDTLASAAPTPGGGAAGAVNAAIGAALIGMVCELTIDKPRFAEVAAGLTAVRDEAAALRRDCLAAADEDAAAFATVMAAYRLPKNDPAGRTAAIQRALVLAAEAPLRAAGLAARVIGLAEQIAGTANPQVISDVAVAAASARAAVAAGIVNVEVNVAGLTDPDQRAALTARLDPLLAALADADRVVAQVRARLA